LAKQEGQAAEMAQTFEANNEEVGQLEYEKE